MSHANDYEAYRRSVEAASVDAARIRPRSGFPTSLLGYIVVYGGVLTAAWLIYAVIMFVVARLFS